MSEQNTFEKIYEVVKQIPKGKVATYGQVAALAGNRRWARVVGYALHANPNEQEIPCYRVVTKDGRVSKAFAFGGENRQMELLAADGVEFEDGHVVMEGTPKEIFSQVDTLKHYRLDVPQVTILADELKKRGLDIPDGILTKEELVEALCQLK